MRNSDRTTSGTTMDYHHWKRCRGWRSGTKRACSWGKSERKETKRKESNQRKIDGRSHQVHRKAGQAGQGCLVSFSLPAARRRKKKDSVLNYLTQPTNYYEEVLLCNLLSRLPLQNYTRAVRRVSGGQEPRRKRGYFF